VAPSLRDGAAFIVIHVLIDTGRPARANLSLDSGLLEAVGDAAKASRLTRSSFIATPACEKISAGAKARFLSANVRSRRKARVRFHVYMKTNETPRRSVRLNNRSSISNSLESGTRLREQETQ
jgi:hypothetical protein